MHRPSVVVLGVVACLVLAGCPLKVVGGTFGATKPYEKKARTAADIALHFEKESPPACRFSRIGLVTFNGNKEGMPWGRNTEATDAEALEGLRAYLASLGVDGALNVRCGGAGTTGSGVCDGIAYLCEDGAAPAERPSAAAPAPGPAAAPPSCKTHLDCKAGLTCPRGQCVQPSCVADKECGAGRFCTIEGECEPLGGKK